MPAKVKVSLPELVGSRARIQDLLDESTPADLQDTIVEVDFTETDSIIQGACDELVRQLIIRKASRVLFISASGRQERHVRLAKQLRLDQGTFLSDFI